MLKQRKFPCLIALIVAVAVTCSACASNVSSDNSNQSNSSANQSNCSADYSDQSMTDIDYSDKSNWAYYGIGKDKSADLFLVCPTVDMGANDNHNMSMTDEDTKGNFVGALNMERGIYEDSLTMYAPYYRQVTFPVYSMTEKEADPYFEIAYSDVRSAFLSYIKNSSPDRPFVLAGFSQGSDMVLRLLEEFFNDSAYQDRLVAAYCIGWRVTDTDLKDHSWLKMAQGADDTGTIITFSSEAKNVTESLIVPDGVKTYSINPLNWKTDSTRADKSKNLGACFTDYSGKITKEVPKLTGAYIDKTRGTLKLPDITPADYSNSLFPDGVYHLYDYQFFFRNLQENVALRLETYLSAQANDKAA